eukprot:393000_1
MNSKSTNKKETYIMQYFSLDVAVFVNKLLFHPVPINTLKELCNNASNVTMINKKNISIHKEMDKYLIYSFQTNMLPIFLNNKRYQTLLQTNPCQLVHEIKQTKMICITLGSSEALRARAQIKQIQSMNFLKLYVACARLFYSCFKDSKDRYIWDDTKNTQGFNQYLKAQLQKQSNNDEKKTHEYEAIKSLQMNWSQLLTNESYPVKNSNNEVNNIHQLIPQKISLIEDKSIQATAFSSKEIIELNSIVNSFETKLKGRRKISWRMVKLTLNTNQNINMRSRTRSELFKIYHETNKQYEMKLSDSISQEISKSNQSPDAQPIDFDDEKLIEMTSKMTDRILTYSKIDIYRVILACGDVSSIPSSNMAVSQQMALAPNIIFKNYWKHAPMNIYTIEHTNVKHLTSPWTTLLFDLHSCYDQNKNLSNFIDKLFTHNLIPYITDYLQFGDKRNELQLPFLCMKALELLSKSLNQKHIESIIEYDVIPIAINQLYAPVLIATPALSTIFNVMTESSIMTDILLDHYNILYHLERICCTGPLPLVGITLVIVVVIAQMVNHENTNIGIQYKYHIRRILDIIVAALPIHSMYYSLFKEDLILTIIKMYNQLKLYNTKTITKQFMPYCHTIFIAFNASIVVCNGYFRAIEPSVAVNDFILSLCVKYLFDADITINHFRKLLILYNDDESFMEGLLTVFRNIIITNHKYEKTYGISNELLSKYPFILNMFADSLSSPVVLIKINAMDGILSAVKLARYSDEFKKSLRMFYPVLVNEVLSNNNIVMKKVLDCFSLYFEAKKTIVYMMNRGFVAVLCSVLKDRNKSKWHKNVFDLIGVMLEFGEKGSNIYGDNKFALYLESSNTKLKKNSIVKLINKYIKQKKSDRKECVWCHNDTIALRCCSKCKQLWYCSKSHQKFHWNNIHRYYCNLK